MADRHQTDSRALAELREAFKLSTGEHATPYRLGRYAREQGIAITDLGAHSKRWREAFAQGQDEAGRRLKRAQQLRLFAWGSDAPSK